MSQIGTETVLDIDEQSFCDAFDRRPVLLEHRLVDHPLLQLDRLAELADALPVELVEHNLGDVPEVLPDRRVQTIDARPGELVRGIADNNCWINLRHIERDPDYRALLEQVVGEVTRLPGVDGGGVVKIEGYVFLSAPGATTPLHLDPEHNMLLQVTGTKTMFIGRFADDEAHHRTIEDFHGAGVLNLATRPEEMPGYELRPGTGVYVPIHHPHIVKNDDAPSISFSVTWSTRQTDKDEAVHKVNHLLRKAGLSPTPIGAKPGLDFAKQAAWRAPRGLKRALRKQA